MQFLSDTQTHKGLVRKINEDACLALPESGVWAVADGMGGHEAGDVASQLVMDTLSRAISRHPGEPSVEMLTAALHEANAAVCRFAEEHLDGQTAGSTVVVLFIERGQYHVLWVGDSRCYLLRDRRLSQLSSDHSQVNEMVQQGLISADEAEHHELANVITRAIGVERQIEVDHISGSCLSGDLYLLCTDGLNKEIPDNEIEQYMGHGSIAEANKALLHSTLVSGAKDNVTCILVSLNVSGLVSECSKTIPLYLKTNV
ncbi:PP2C family protein-serine/threonine phosphatase [Shewanella salipaludis]|uniref:Serine/threonine-protein phosphatase n=1 Tax=Shewanella salipaludis TaxID=2723052 RepID=A0A972FRU3_9GAMM|nr:protein phosphatase 2C domain-containing protein [Shewanella salipaludis]NMH64099.1 serine/threonine-protein phosphatase [Shewanella salipaludis]